MENERRGGEGNRKEERDGERKRREKDRMPGVFSMHPPIHSSTQEASQPASQ